MGEIEMYYLSLLIRQLVYAPTVFHRAMALQRLAGYAAKYSKQIDKILPEVAELAIRASIFTQRLQSLVAETRSGNVIDIRSEETDEYEQLLTMLAKLETKVVTILDTHIKPLAGVFRNE